jgi:hypothetical protein
MKEQLIFRVRERLGGGGTAVLRLSTNASSSLPAQKNQIATAWSLRLAGLLALTIAALLALVAPSASAAPPSQFGSEGTGAGQIEGEAQDIAVDNEGSVYVADNHNRIDKFDPAGNFIRAFLSGLLPGAAA